MCTFAQLFVKYRLKSEFISLSEFADAFARKGQIYDQSIFYHWQKGKRVPTRRIVVVILIQLFMENGGILSIDQANEFLESAGHGYLTDTERMTLQNKPYIVTTHPLI